MKKSIPSKHFSSSICGIARGRMQPVQPPTNDLQALLTPREFEMAKQRFNDSLIGSEETVKEVRSIY